MNIIVGITHNKADCPLFVDILVPGDRKVIDLSVLQNQIELNVVLDNDKQNQTVDLILQTTNPNITKFPVVIESILLDNFYQKESFSCCGRPCYSDEFLKYAKLKSMFIDTSVTDSDQLNFLGQLIFTFKWPFWRNLV